MASWLNLLCIALLFCASSVTTQDITVTINPNCQCGVKTLNRIVNGNDATPGEYPWIAQLRHNGIICGSALISDKYVLTAAHCVGDTNPADVELSFGAHALNDNGPNVIRRGIDSINIHPLYESLGFGYDLALLRLTETLPSTIIPVCIPPENELYEGRQAMAAGWGGLYSGGPLGDPLQEVELTIISNQECEQRLGPQNPSVMCTFNPGQGICGGDSGSPLIVQNSANTWNVVGVDDFIVNSCGDETYPAGYSRVGTSLNWIKENTQDGVYCAGIEL